jgi:phospholipase C
VPLIVLSPYAKVHHVSHVVTDHTSILRFIEARFKLPALTKRDANADPLYDMFDFSQTQLATPPSVPPTVVDQAKLAACEAMFPRAGGDGGAPPDMAQPGDMAQPPPADGGAGD